MRLIPIPNFNLFCYLFLFDFLLVPGHELLEALLVNVRLKADPAAANLMFPGVAAFDRLLAKLANDIAHFQIPI